MNERIKELAIQVMHSDPEPHLTTELYSFTQPEFEKFAELIIQKCIAQIALIGISNFENEDISWTVETAIDSIQEHFGVKNA